MQIEARLVGVSKLIKLSLYDDPAICWRPVKGEPCLSRPVLAGIGTSFSCDPQRIRDTDNGWMIREWSEVLLLSVRSRNLRLQGHRLTNTGQLRVE